MLKRGRQAESLMDPTGPGNLDGRNAVGPNGQGLVSA